MYKCRDNTLTNLWIEYGSVLQSQGANSQTYEDLLAL